MSEEDGLKTVFVLGAGASYDFGFPTGEELIEEIHYLCLEINSEIEAKKKFQNREAWWKSNEQTDRPRNLSPTFQPFLTHVATQAYFDENFQNKFIDRLKRGLPLSKSIDNYLKDQDVGDFTKFGKLVIATALLRAERSGLISVSSGRSDYVKLFGEDDENKLTTPNFMELRKTWLVTFFRELRTDNGKSEGGFEAVKARLKKIAIVTFNYERSFEYFMREAFQAYQADMSKEQLDELMEILNGQIVHPYGSLGSLEELPFATELKDVEDWSVFADRLAIFTESDELKSDLNKQREKARGWVQNAENVVFLGFGFHEQNMEYLGLNRLKPRKPPYFYATTFGWSEYSQNALHKKLFRGGADLKIDNSHKLQDRFIVPDTCKKLLEEYAVNIFPK